MSPPTPSALPKLLLPILVGAAPALSSKALDFVDWSALKVQLKATRITAVAADSDDLEARVQWSFAF